jgi:hypothetical protein
VRELALAVTRWPWLNRIFAAWLVLMLALRLGVLSFAAVAEVSVDCRREPIPIIKLEDGVSDLVTEEECLRCRFKVGDFAATFPPRGRHQHDLAAELITP